MPHKHKPRRNKMASMLTSKDDVLEDELKGLNDRDNIIKKMSHSDIEEVRTIIEARYVSAKEKTGDIAKKMAKWDKLYKGEWEDGNLEEDEKVFLPKTREQVQTVYAYIINLVSRLHPIVAFSPMVSSLEASTEEYKRAKVSEALLDFYMNDVWKVRDDVFPKWLKHFLKYTMAVWKVTYREDDFLPDLKIDVVDRALLYIDPYVDDIKDSRWVIEKYYLPRSEVIDLVDQGHWELDKTLHEKLTTGYSRPDDEVFNRYYGKNTANDYSVEEDELIEIWDYWQAPRQGLDDAYAVIIGGEGGDLVRYGRNPYPYKGIPYRGKSYDPSEHEVDGTGLVQMYQPFQEVINNFLNMRISDVRKNIIRPVAATGKFIDEQTQQDFKEGNKIVRLSAEALEEASNNPNFDLRKHFMELPFSTSTGELLVQDLPFILGQGKEASSISDVFKGQAPPHQATLGQVQEQLNQNQGVFRPIYLQVMRGFEELADICQEYFRDPLFFPSERIVQVVGENKYTKEIEGFHNIGGEINVRSINPDELDVNVTTSAVNGADALASRTFMMSSLQQIFASIGQIPEMFELLKGELDFPRIVEIMLNHTGHDIESFRMSPEEKQAKTQEDQQEQQQAMQMQQQQQELVMQQQQQMMQMQSQINVMEEQAKQQARANSQIAIEQSKTESQLQLQQERLHLENENMIDQIVSRVSETLASDIAKMDHEAKLESGNEGVSVGHGNNVNE